MGKKFRSWIQEVKKYLERNNIKAEKATERKEFRGKVLKMEGFQGRIKNKTGLKPSEERKINVMKDFLIFVQ